MRNLSHITQMALLAAILFLCAACSGTTPDGPNPGAVVPGVGIKEVSLFDSRAQVEKNLGEPASVTKNPFNEHHVIVQYPAKGIEISYLDDAVGSIVLYSPGMKDGVNWSTYQGATKQGIWPESNVKTIKEKMGYPIKEFPKAVVYPGLWIRLDEKGGVESFSISKDEANQLNS